MVSDVPKMLSRILVVDDEPDLEHLIRQKFRREIRKKELDFVFAQNGVEAIDVLSTNGEIDLVLTDINMPKMDGLTLLTRIQELNPNLKSVIVSAYGDMENIRTAMNRGAFDFITKPIDLADLEITINKSLKELKTLKEALQSRDQLVGIQQELKIATEIQTSILPRVFPAFPDRHEFDIYAEMITAREVGGDFYDFFLIDDHHLGFVIGDVSGKGIPAAMMMAVCRTFLKATALKGIPPHQCLEEVNRVVVDESLPTMFVTIYYGVLNLRTGELSFCNGGHNHPYLLSHDGDVRLLKIKGGLLVGGIKDAEYETQKMQLHPDDTLFLYTDGVTEARNATKEQFEDNRLGEYLTQYRNLTPKEICREVVSAVQLFADGAPQADDITVLAIKYTP